MSQGLLIIRNGLSWREINIRDGSAILDVCSRIQKDGVDMIIILDKNGGYFMWESIRRMMDSDTRSALVRAY